MRSRLCTRSPYDASVKSPVKRRMYDIVKDALHHKDGLPNPNTVLPEGSRTTGGWRGKIFMPAKADPYGVMYGGGRADVRLSMGGDGEIYVLSKSDGMIRKLAAVATAAARNCKANCCGTLTGQILRRDMWRQFVVKVARVIGSRDSPEAFIFGF